MPGVLWGALGHDTEHVLLWNFRKAVHNQRLQGPLDPARAAVAPGARSAGPSSMAARPPRSANPSRKWFQAAWATLPWESL